MSPREAAIRTGHTDRGHRRRDVDPLIANDGRGRWRKFRELGRRSRSRDSGSTSANFRHSGVTRGQRAEDGGHSMKISSADICCRSANKNSCPPTEKIFHFGPLSFRSFMLPGNSFLRTFHVHRLAVSEQNIFFFAASIFSPRTDARGPLTT